MPLTKDSVLKGETTPEMFGLPPDVKILSQVDRELLLCEIPIRRIIWQDVQTDAVLVKNVGELMENETQNRKYNGQMDAGLVAQVVDTRMDIRGALYLCQGFHRMTYQNMKGAKYYYAQIRLNSSYEKMLDLRMVGGLGHRAVDLPRVVEWVSQLWGLQPWASRVTPMRGFSMACFPNITGRSWGISKEEAEIIRTWIKTNCQRWDRSPNSILHHLDTAEKANPKLIEHMRMGQKGKHITPAQVRGIVQVLPGRENWAKQSIAEKIAVRQALTEHRVRRMAAALLVADSKKQIACIISKRWDQEGRLPKRNTLQFPQLIFAGETQYSSNTNVKLGWALDQLFDSLLREIDLKIDMALMARKLSLNDLEAEEVDEVHKTTQPRVAEILENDQSASDREVIYTREESDVPQDTSTSEDRNTTVAKAIESAKAGHLEELAMYVRDEMESKLKRYVIHKFGITDELDDLIQEVYIRMFGSIGRFNIDNDKGPCASLQSFLYTITRNLVLDKFRSNEYKMSQASDELDGVLGVEDPSIRDDQMHDFFDQRAVRHAILEIRSEEQRAVLMMRFMRGMKAEAIAKILGLQNAGAIRALQHRGLAALGGILRTKMKET